MAPVKAQEASSLMYKMQAVINGIAFFIILFLVYSTYNESIDNVVRSNILFFMGGILLLLAQNIIAFITRTTWGSIILAPTSIGYMLLFLLMFASATNIMTLGRLW